MVIENFVEIQKQCVIGQDTWVRSYVRIGNGCQVGANVTLKCSAILGPGTTVEDNAFIGPQVICLSDLETKVTGTVIEKGAFVGAGTKIMPGITVGAGAIIGAMSFVNRNCEPGKKYAGVPIREI